MHRLGIEVGDRGELIERRLPLVWTDPLMRPERDIRLRQRRFECPGPHLLNVLDRALGCLRHGDQSWDAAASATVAGARARWIADRVGEHSADREICPARR